MAVRNLPTVRRKALCKAKWLDLGSILSTINVDTWASVFEPPLGIVAAKGPGSISASFCDRRPIMFFLLELHNSTN
jgi:hypothetical protein